MIITSILKLILSLIFLGTILSLIYYIIFEKKVSFLLVWENIEPILLPLLWFMHKTVSQSHNVFLVETSCISSYVSSFHTLYKAIHDCVFDTFLEKKNDSLPFSFYNK